MSAIVEFFGYYVKDKKVDWEAVVKKQISKYTGKISIKGRKSQPHIKLGTVVVRHGVGQRSMIIDPERFLEKGQVFLDCIHLLTMHEPGNELHLVPEVKIPGGNVDFFLVSAREGVVKDFVGIELQALDTTGSLWEERQKLLVELGILSKNKKIKHATFGINWKMTAKTTLLQLHHKVKTFEHVNKKLVLVCQDVLLDDMRKKFSFSHFHDPALIGDSMHIHAYELKENRKGTQLSLSTRVGTNASGLAKSLHLRAKSRIHLDEIIKILQRKMSAKTLFEAVKIKQ